MASRWGSLVPWKKLTVEIFADAIHFDSGKEIKDVTCDLGIEIQGENGIQKAAQIIINCIEQKGVNLTI
jgi:hypothetical protein